MPSALLPHRAVIRLTGDDRVGFLQRLISNDVARATEHVAIHAALLTAQGRFLHELFVIGDGESLLLEGERERLADLERRLKMYKLRAKIAFEALPDWSVAVAWRDDGTMPTVSANGVVGYADPRMTALGLRLAGPSADVAAAAASLGPVVDAAGYDLHRLALGVPDGSRDLVPEKAILLENGFDELHGVDWKKGCYIGQELTARTKYRGLVKKRLVPVRIEGALPEPGTLVMAGDREAGELRSGRGDRALALLRLEFLEAAERPELTAGGVRLVPEHPAWLAR
jgi:folate-binding protein YgfZ